MQINLKTEWDLSKIYTDESLLFQDIEFIKNEYPKYLDFRGKLNNPQTLLEYEKFSENLGIVEGRVGLYISLKSNLDVTDSKYQEIQGNLGLIYSDFGEYTSFIGSELQQIPDEFIKSWISEGGLLEPYRYSYESFLREKKHILNEEQSLLLSLVPSTNASDTFEYLFDSDMNWSKIVYNDEEIEVDDIVYGKALYSKDREYRKTVYKEFYKPIIQHKNVLCNTLQTTITASTKYAKIYKYDSSLNKALDSKELPIDFYDNLVSVTKENAHILQRYANLKKRVLGLDELHHYDTYVSIFQKSEKEYTYQEGVELVLESLKPMGEEYISYVKMALENGRVDVNPKKNKSGGAFSTGVTYGIEPYVLLNWKGTLDDVFTLTHELGHNIHSYLTSKNQPYHYAGYSIFLAEVASIFNENLLLNYLLSIVETKEDKMVLIDQQLKNYTFTFFRQVQFADFERQVHKSIESGISFSPQSFCDLYSRINKEFWGDSIVMDEEESYIWSRISHFYRPFYVYQYATGLAYAQNLASSVSLGKENAVENVLNFLKSGCSKSVKDILMDCGINVMESNSVQAVFDNMEKLLDELENLI